MAKIPKFICINKKSYQKEIDRAIKELKKDNLTEAIQILEGIIANLEAEKPCMQDKQAIV